MPVTEEKRIVYVTPQQGFEEDELDLWQLFLPLVRYKLQILVVLSFGVMTALLIPRFFGTTVYRNSLVYRYTHSNAYYSILHGDETRTSKDEVTETIDQLFHPERDFLTPVEIIKAKSLFATYWGIQPLRNGKDLLEFVKENQLILFNTGKSPERTVTLSVTTDDPSKTVDALNDLFTHFNQRNNQFIRDRLQILLNKLNRKRRELTNRLIAASENLPPIRYLKVDTYEFFQNDPSTIFVLKKTQNVVFGTWIRPESNTNRLEISRVHSILRSLRRAPVLGEQLTSTLSALQKRDNQILDLRVQLGIIDATVSYIEERGVKEENKKRQSKIIELEDKFNTLSEKLGKLDAQKNQLSLDISILNTTLNGVFTAQSQLKNAPESVWTITERKRDAQTQKAKRNESEKDNQKPSFSQQSMGVVHLSDYIERIDTLNERLIRTSIAIHSLANDQIKLYKLIETPSIETNTKQLSFNYPDTKKSVSEKRIEDPNAPIYFSKKVVLITLVLAFFVATLSVFLRVMITDVKERDSLSSRKQDFIQALKHWRL